LAAPERDTPQRRQSMRETMAHELAHQWFGNLVTQASWKDVWLSEGFATWMGAKLSEGEMGAPLIRAGIMALDSTEKARPVRVAMHSRAEMKDVYSPFVYRKAGAILAMLEGWLGADAFQRGIRRYLREHAFGNASTEDLASALRAETGQEVAPILRGLLDRPGVPSVSARVDCRRVTFEPIDSPLPVCMRWDGVRKCVVVGPGHTEAQLDAPTCPPFISMNASGLGYYRSNIGTQDYGQLTTPERLALADDVGAMLAGKRLSAESAMPILGRMAYDRDANVVLAALRVAAGLVLSAPTGEREKYASWLQSVFGVTTPR
jgi:alanyl aminopeptidase